LIAATICTGKRQTPSDPVHNQKLPSQWYRKPEESFYINFISGILSDSHNAEGETGAGDTLHVVVDPGEIRSSISTPEYRMLKVFFLRKSRL